MKFPPHNGQITWSNEDQRWVIKVTYSDGALIQSEDVFQCPVLWDHLQRAGVRSVLASHDTKAHVCKVWRREAAGDLSRQGDKILSVLNTHYVQFKGRPIKWTLR